MTHTTQRKAKAGMTLIELTVIMFVLLFIIGMSFIGVKAWKSGSDRAACVLNIYHAQEAVRSFSNLNGFNPGQTLASVDVEAKVFGLDSFVNVRPECPSDGAYSTKKNTIPAYGTLYLTCSLAGSGKHQPDNFHQW
jgi:hypothetical protein